MGIALPQLAPASEDRVSGVQIVDGSLRFDKSKTQRLVRTPSSAGNRRTWTWSGWVKRNNLSTSVLGHTLFQRGDTYIYFAESANIDNIGVNLRNAATNYWAMSSAVYRDVSGWYHIVVAIDTTLSNANDRVKIWINNSLITAFSISSYTSIGQNYEPLINSAAEHGIGGTGGNLDAQLSNVYFIDGQALDPSYFGYTDPLTNTWRPKKLSSSIAFGTNGFYLPFDGNSPIGQDRSGNNNNWTPVNFGGSNTLEKATGALPILNTDGGGKVARVGVRTDSNASSLVLALPLVGIKSDFSNAINSGTSNKAITANGSAASSNTTSNFYGGSFNFGTAAGSAVYPNATSSDFAFGTGDFTVEFWFYSTATSRKYLGDFRSNGAGGSSAAVGPFIIWADNGSDGTGTWIRYGNNSSSPNFDLLGGRGLPPINTWHHLAIVRKNNTVSGYLNGVLTNSTTDSTNYSTNTSFAFGNAANNTVNFSGYLQDLRVYKGVAKYTQNFIPASTDPDILPDTPSGVAYSSNVALVPSTDGAVAFDGTDDYLSVGANADFNILGNGTFTIEFFLFANALNGSFADYVGVFNGVSTGWLIYQTGSNLDFYTNGSQRLTTPHPPIQKWSHIAITRDGTTTRLFVDGVLQSSTTSSLGSDYSGALQCGGASGRNDLNGFISNLHVINGTALYTSNFTPPTGPLTSTENTKLLCCKSNSSATAFDVSPGTITSVNALATNFNPFTANINAVRGQESGYCTFNPLDKDSGNTVLNGNLTVNTSSAGQGFQRATMYVSSGKWYWEITVTDISNNASIGIAGPSTIANTTNYIGATADSYGYVASNGNKYNNSASASYGATYTSNDVIGVALDLDAGTLIFYKNGVSQGTAYSSLSGSFSPAVSDVSNSGGSVIVANFGQKPFKFPPPTGFQPLALANTPRPTIVRPDQYVGVSTWSGAQSGSGGLTRQISTGFQPDFVWIKQRNQAYSTGHQLYDSVRGAGAEKELNSSGTAAEGAGNIETYGWLNSFDKTGFTVKGGSTDYDYVNKSGVNYVGWAWKAGHPTTPTSGAVAFDGSGDYLSLSSNADFAMGTGDFTAECWIYLTSYSNAEGGYSARVFDSNTAQLGIYITSDGTGYVGGLVGGTDIRSSTAPVLQSWSHLAISRSGTTFRIFLNGNIIHTATNSSSVASSGDFIIGARGSGTGGFPGFISNLHIVKGTALYTSNFTPSTSPLTNVTNTKLLCCQSPTSATAYEVSPGTITSVNATATSYNPFDTFSVDGTGYSTASAAGLTAGTITPTGASVNTKSGFSIITWTGNGSTSATVPHGLNNVPAMVILKSRDDGTYQWPVWHSYYGTSTTNKLVLSRNDSTIAGDTNGYVTSLTSTTFGFGGGTAAVNANTQRYVAYLWAEIPGFSKFGSYTGNGSADGPMIVTGFRPRWLMVKRTDSVDHWFIIDSLRDSINPCGKLIRANTADAEVTSNQLDFLSNGFKLRVVSGGYNTNGATYIYAAFAEAPSFNLYGAQANAR